MVQADCRFVKPLAPFDSVIHGDDGHWSLYSSVCLFCWGAATILLPLQIIPQVGTKLRDLVICWYTAMLILNFYTAFPSLACKMEVTIVITEYQKTNCICRQSVCALFSNELHVWIHSGMNPFSCSSLFTYFQDIRAEKATDNWHSPVANVPLPNSWACKEVPLMFSMVTRLCPCRRKTLMFAWYQGLWGLSWNMRLLNPTSTKKCLQLVPKRL